MGCLTLLFRRRCDSSVNQKGFGPRQGKSCKTLFQTTLEYGLFYNESGFTCGLKITSRIRLLIVPVWRLLRRQSIGLVCRCPVLYRSPLRSGAPSDLRRSMVSIEINHSLLTIHVLCSRYECTP